MREQEACPASRMLDFEGFVTVSSVLLVELTAMFPIICIEIF